jgi:hypothetical protein
VEEAADMAGPLRNDHEPLALVYDSAQDRTSAERRAARPHPRAVAFEGAERAIEVELFESGLMGQLLPPTASDVIVESPRGWAHALTTDDRGVFSLAEPPPRVFRLRFDVVEHTVVTDWLHT